MKLAAQFTVTATDEAAGRDDWLNSSENKTKKIGNGKFT